MNKAQLAQSWRTEADDLDRMAKVYNRKCIEAKGVQMLLLAKQLRGCADQVEALDDEARKTRRTGSTATRSVPQAASQQLAEEQPEPQAHDWQSTTGAQSPDQAA